MSDATDNRPKLCRYFVDEAGDGVLFTRKGKPLVGEPDFPQHFMLGMTEIPNPEAIAADLDELRTAVLADPYFKDVPSVQPDARKTALHFHAKDDLPEIRRDVFKIILKHEFHFYAVVKSMKAVLEYVRSRNQMDSSYRYKPNELYDLTVRMLFKQRLHLHTRCEVVFARRGKSDRTNALRRELDHTRQKFIDEMGPHPDTEIEVIPAYPNEQPGLQVTDYCLWALQRCFERREDRFLQLIWDRVALIHDVDDKQTAKYGSYYNKKKPPLSAAALEARRV